MSHPYSEIKSKKVISFKLSNHARPGMTLISTLISIAIILTALIGTISFRYYATLDARKAAAQATASRIALMLCENWRGINGDTAYDPVAYLGSDIKLTLSEGISEPDDFTLLGSYKIVPNEEEDGAQGADYFVTLSWKDVQPGLRALNVTVSWAQRGQRGLENTDKSFRLTTYVTTL